MLIKLKLLSKLTFILVAIIVAVLIGISIILFFIFKPLNSNTKEGLNRDKIAKESFSQIPIYPNSQMVWLVDLDHLERSASAEFIEDGREASYLLATNDSVDQVFGFYKTNLLDGGWIVDEDCPKVVSDTNCFDVHLFLSRGNLSARVNTVNNLQWWRDRYKKDFSTMNNFINKFDIVLFVTLP